MTDVHDPKTAAAGVTGVRVALSAGGVAHGARTLTAHPAQAEPDRRLRLHELRLARPRPGAPAHRRVLRERRQGRRRGGHPRAGHPRVLRPAQHRRARGERRDVARPAGSHHPPDGQAARWHPLRAHRVGRGLCARSPVTSDPRFSRRSHLLHVRTHLERGGVRLPAVRPRLRHQQPAGLLEHVPRVHQRRAGGGDRHRQGQRQPARHLRRRRASSSPARTRAPTIRACCRRSRSPSGGARRSSPSTRCARPGWSTSATRRGRAASSAGASTWPTCTCPSASTATSLCSRPSGRFSSSGTPSTTSSSRSTRRASTPGPSTCATSTTTRSSGPPASAGSRSPRPPR